ncbi:TPA: hypothetical protein ACGO5D_002293 [Streptococcus suis]
MVAKDLIDEIQFRFLPGMGEGIYFELMIHAKKITTVPEKLYIYRSRTNSLSSTPSPEVNLDSMINNRIMGERNPEYKEYFTFKVIEDLIHLIASAVKTNDKLAYKNARHELYKLNYLKNPYLSKFYKAELPLYRYFIKVYILPFNFNIARLIYTFVYKP